MKKINFLILTKKINPKLIIVIKKIYKLKKDTKVNDWENIFLTKKEFLIIKKIAKKKIKGKDVTFEIGYKYFRNNKLKIKKGVFVPQYDTEQIIDLLLDLDLNLINVLEIGTGSGAIAISIVNETNYNVTAIDINPFSIDLSTLNDKKKIINFINIDFKKYETNKKFDVMISNPPYIDIYDKNIELWVKKNQPKKSIYAKNKGLAFYELIFLKSKNLLNNKGYIILEIGFNQKDELKKIIENYYKNFKFIKDYQGFYRFVVIKNYE